MARYDDLASGVVLDAQDAHLLLEGMNTTIHTQVTRRSDRGMTVEQPLPFLQLRTMVQDQTERRARIESVSMLVCDGMPRLILDLAYEPGAVADPEPDAPDSVQCAPTEPSPQRMVRPRLDDTQSFEQPLRTAAGMQVPEPSAPPASRESTLVFDTVPPPAGEPRIGEDALIDDMVEKMQADRLGPRLARGWATVKPHVRHAAILVVAFVMRSARRSYPHVRGAGAAAIAMSGRFVQALRNLHASRAARAAQAKQQG